MGPSHLSTLGVTMEDTQATGTRTGSLEPVSGNGTRDASSAPRHRMREPTVTRLSSLQAPIAWALAALGIVLRLRQFAFRRSLWNDEASLALNIVGRTFGGLTRPLALEQGAPVGFLWMEKAVTEVLGPNEYALRLVPLVAGVASVLVFRSLAVRVLPPLGSWVAIALFAVSPALVYYASESKQYGVDVAAVVILAWFMAWILDGPLSTRNCVGFGLVASVLVWCSYPAIFLAFGVSLVVIVVNVRRRHWERMALFMGASLVWAASVGVEYLVSLRKLHGDPALLGYWMFAFAPRPLRVGTTVTWLRQDIRAVAAYPWHLAVLPLAVVMLLLGLAMLLWRSPAIGLLILVLGGIMIVAGVAHEYPLADRLVLFSIPFVCLCVGGVLLVSRRPPVQVLCVLLVLVVTGAEFSTAASAITSPYTKTEVREAYVAMLAHRHPGDAVLVEWEGIPDFLYYNQTLGVRAEGTFRLTSSATPCDNAAQLAKLEQWSRVWLIFGIDPGTEAGSPITQYTSAFASTAKVISRYDSPGPSGAVLLKIDHGSPVTAPSVKAPTWQPGPYGCITVQLLPLASLFAGLK
jgi:hypothetical protein